VIQIVKPQLVTVQYTVLAVAHATLYQKAGHI